MATTISFKSSLPGTAVRVIPVGQSSGGRQQLSVVGYDKKRGKVKGGYGGSTPNEKKGFCKIDASGQKNKGIGAYRFAKKYGDINDYSPIYDEYTWTPAGDTYALGTKGLTAWAGLLAVVLAVSVYFVVSTSQL